MRRSTHQVAVALFLVALTGCGQESTPASPSSSRSFLEGVWTGTVTISGRVSQRLRSHDMDLRGHAGHESAVVQRAIQSQHAFLPITATVLSQITPGNTPPARISTQGTYPSPRGCAAAS